MDKYATEFPILYVKFFLVSNIQMISVKNWINIDLHYINKSTVTYSFTKYLKLFLFFFKSFMDFILYLFVEIGHFLYKNKIDFK